MKKFYLILIFLLTATSLSAQHNHGADNTLNAKEVDSEHSLYHLEAKWTDHRGETVSLADFRGTPVIVVMFYGNCTDVCPILIQDAWRLYSGVDESLREDVNVLAVSFDTENDTPEVLNNYAKYEQLDIPGWHFITADDADVRTLAMMLGVQYSKKSDGHFAHSNLVTVLDEEGRIAHRVEGLNQPMNKAEATIESIMAGLNK
ncbi:SCO family protein [Fodinibius sp.]|uniref:SCO family protein n=1 Tax=Fodinibius sp. TaxID=1872440 RepID=UPI002ACE7A59|nr:SCO family protein [Fodinibius sp.]MDZ7657700.1 SCO family protein [Fodinibius sp.]